MNTIRVKRRRDDPPVSTLVVQSQTYSSGSSTGSTTKRRRTDAQSKAPAIYRLQETLPSPTAREPTVLASVPQVVLTEPTTPAESTTPSRPIRRPVSKRSLLSTTTSVDDDLPSETRRFHVARRIEGSAGKRSAVLMEGKRKRKRPVGEFSDMHRRLEELRGNMDVEKGHERKRPHVHPLEHKEWVQKIEHEKVEEKVENKKEEPAKKQEDDFEISDELEGMVLDYLKDHPAAIDALPPTPTKPVVQNKLGGGVGGGRWDDNQESDLSSDEDELGPKYVYDVYKRATPAPEDMDVDMDAVAEKNGKDWGIVVLEDSDEEEFFMNADDGDSDDGKWESEDEDSNAEEYYKNEYPEEPSEDEDEFGRDDSDVEDAYGTRRPWETWKTGRRIDPDDEEYDLDDESDYDEPRLPAGLPRLPSMQPANRF